MSDLLYDIVVVGGGPTGFCASLMAAQNGYSTLLLAPSGSHIESDARTTALMMPAISMLRDLSVWDNIAAKTAPLRTLRIIDDTKRLFRAPTVDFHAHEIDEEAFGYNIPNHILNSGFEEAVLNQENITRLDAMVSGVLYESENATLTLSDGTIVKAQLVIGADGVNSITRQAAGIDIKNWSYEQTACVMAFDHERNHCNTSTEFHTPFGPFTQVPLIGNRSSLVWVMQPDDATTCADLSTEALCARIEQQMQSMLGKISNVTPVQSWPLSSFVAHKFSSKRLILIGQAAHAFPPIGAQGLNLGFRDVADFSLVIKGVDGDVGAEPITSAYDHKRRADVYLRTGAVDALNRSLLSGFLPLQAGRAIGMSVLKNVAPLRNILMREGIKSGGLLKGRPSA